MNDRHFLDSNVIVYAFGNDERKKDIAKQLIKTNPLISTQVINEVINISFRKLNLSNDEVDRLFALLNDNCEIKTIAITTIESALSIVKKYGYSYFDSLMLASSVENECQKIYSEDLQHNQVIEKTLTIINPFVK